MRSQRSATERSEYRRFAGNSTTSFIRWLPAVTSADTSVQFFPQTPSSTATHSPLLHSVTIAHLLELPMYLEHYWLCLCDVFGSVHSTLPLNSLPRLLRTHHSFNLQRSHGSTWSYLCIWITLNSACATLSAPCIRLSRSLYRSLFNALFADCDVQHRPG